MADEKKPEPKAVRVFNQSNHPIEGIRKDALGNFVPFVIEPNTEGEVDENNPAVKIWLAGNEETGIEPLLVAPGSQAKRRARVVTAEEPADEHPRVGDKHGTRK